MNIINATAYSTCLFRFKSVDLLTDSWFMGETASKLQTIYNSTTCDTAGNLLDRIGDASVAISVREIAVSRRTRTGDTLYSTIYIAPDGQLGMSATDGGALIRGCESADVIKVFVWLEAKCNVKDSHGTKRAQVLPFMEIVCCAEACDGRPAVSALITCAIASLWANDNRAAMLLIWLLSEAPLRKHLVRPSIETDWGGLNAAIDCVQGDLNAAAQSLSASQVSDADIVMYEGCSMVIPVQNCTVYKNFELAHENVNLRLLWDEL